MYVKLLFLLLSAVFICPQMTAQEDLTEFKLQASWHLVEDGNDIAYPAIVPGNIYTDLMDAGAIPDPFVGTNEQDVQWVGETSWTYTTDPFDIWPTVLDKQVVLLRFGGLDTYANVWLNGVHILSANNYHRYWEVDVKSTLRVLDNILEIRFQSPLKIGEEIADSNDQILPGDELRAVTRKPQFHYGWDWGPKLLTMGIHKPIELVAYNFARVVSASTKITSEQGPTSTVQCRIELDCATEYEGEWNLKLNTRDYSGIKNFKKGLNTLVVESPGWQKSDLWQPGHGNQKMHELLLELTLNGRLLTQYHDKFGIRTATLITEKDEAGETFYFEVNGSPVFAKGANYIPVDFFPNRVTPADYERLLNDVCRSNMNMIRVWGGAIYEDDYFYDLCDSLGIMVWQDFMYACAMYPGDEAFLNNARLEAEQQVKRLANHPCIVLWCGNNESSEGWHRWGWQDGLTRKEKKTAWKSYQNLFCKLLPAAVEEFDDVSYWESSPKLGRGDAKHQYSGDAHYWGVWHDGQRFDTLNSVVPRFMSEFGFQSFPAMSTISSYADSGDWNLGSPAILNHEKHPRGLELIRQYMMEDYGMVPENFEDFVWLSQVVQAEGIGLGLEAHRRNAPYCMGTLYWQLNDCWPVASWSSMDYFGVWKPLQFKAAEVFKKEVLSTELSEDSIKVFLLLDEEQSFPVPSSIHISTSSTEGSQIINLTSKGPEVSAYSNLLWTAALSQLCGEFEPDDVIIKVVVDYTLELDMRMTAEKTVTLVKAKDLNLINCAINWNTKRTYDYFEIDMTSECFTKNLWLESDIPGRFDRNFIDLYPGETQRILFFPVDPNQTPHFTSRSLNQLLAPR
jgi:beta-mannosidase